MSAETGKWVDGPLPLTSAAGAGSDGPVRLYVVQFPDWQNAVVAVMNGDRAVWSWPDTGAPVPADMLADVQRHYELPIPPMSRPAAPGASSAEP